MIELIALLQEKTKGNLIEPEAQARRRPALRPAHALRAGAAGREAHHRALDPLADHVSRHRHVARRADDRLRLRAPAARPIRATRRLRPSVYRRDGRWARACWSMPVPTCARRRSRHGIRRVDAILFTHGHADHILGLDDVRRFNALHAAADAVLRRRARRCATSAGCSTTCSIRDAAAAAGFPQLELFAIDGPFCVGGRNRAGPDLSTAQRPILGFRFGAFAYLTDCSRIPDESWPLLEGLDVARARRAARAAAPDALLARRSDRRGAPDRRRGATCFTHMCHDLRMPTPARSCRRDGARL